MAIPKDYFCDGQLNIWDIMSQMEEEKPECDDSICEGCKWRDYEHRELELDERGQTWVYKCPGTACANWKFGTPLNLSAEAQTITKPEFDFEECDHPYCYDRDFLPPLDWIIDFIRRNYNIPIKEVECDWMDSIGKYYEHKFKAGTLEVYDDQYADSKKRFVSIGYQAQLEGFGSPCDNLVRVCRAIEKAIERDERIRHDKRAKSQN